MRAAATSVRSEALDFRFRLNSDWNVAPATAFEGRVLQVDHPVFTAEETNRSSIFNKGSKRGSLEV